MQPRARRPSGAGLFAGALAACALWVPQHAAAEPRAMRLDFGTGLAFHTPRSTATLFSQVEFDRVTTSALDLAIVGRPHDRVSLGGELGYGHAWNGGFTETFNAAFAIDEFTCDVDLDSRDYLRVSGVVSLDVTAGEHRPFITAGAGLWVFLEKEAERSAVCSNGTMDVRDVRTLSSAEEPSLVLGGGVRLWDSRRVSWRVDYRSYVVFEDDGALGVHQLRVGLLFTPRP